MSECLFYICYYVVQLLLRCSDFCIYAVDVDEAVNIIFRILKRVNHLLYLVIRVFHMYQIRRDYEQAGDPQNKKYDLGAAGQKEQDKEACGNSEYTLNTRLQLFTFAAWALSLNASTWDFMSDGSVLVVFEFVSSFMGVPPYLHYIISVSSIRFSMKCMIWINGFLIISPMTSATTMKLTIQADI